MLSEIILVGSALRDGQGRIQARQGGREAETDRDKAGRQERIEARQARQGRMEAGRQGPIEGRQGGRDG